MQQLELYRTIAEQYQRFDFKLERCLMTAETIATLKVAQGDGATYLGAPVEAAKLDAMWFSRASAGGTSAWEIRLVSPTPLSLLERIPSATPASNRQAKLREMEARLFDLINRRKEALEQIIAENMQPQTEEDDEEEDEEDEDGGEGEETDRPWRGNGRQG